MNAVPHRRFLESTTRWLGRRVEDLDDATRRVVNQAEAGRVMAQEPNRRMDRDSTLGERLADRVAQFGGSWTFISLFGAFLFGWAILNTEILGKTAFDPYPERSTSSPSM